MSESELRPLSKLPMMAYYFGFSETGCRAVDEVLSAVACAGKGYHHTEEWSDNKCRDLGFSFPTEGLSYAEVIQKAARVAAERIARLEAQNKALEDMLTASSHALRSYQYGNSSEELAKEMADKIDAAITQAKEQVNG